uniref:ERM family 1 n=1 Tax=Halisarca dujardinii TaxID=2583056 RepID=A0A9F1U443_HALDU|nr:ERM family 1 [Halisarca dujardinii]
MPKSAAVTVRVATMDSDMEFAIKSDATGDQLFSMVAKILGLSEVWYFGIQITDGDGYTAWLKLDKKVMAQCGSKDSPLSFKLRVKFYPEDVAEELIQDITQKLFYLQVKESILSEEMYCAPETAVLLASYAVQTRFGDYDPKKHKPGFLAKERLFAQRVLEQHKLSEKEWEQKVVMCYRRHKATAREDAMMEYLKIAQDLDMYGVNYFSIKNKKGTELWLGVDALGLNVYEKDDKLTPKIGFPWTETRRIMYDNTKITIKSVDKKSPDVVLHAQKLRINQCILALGMGNHHLYLRRRRPDTIDIKAMKEAARQKKYSKQLERAKLRQEKQATEEAMQQKKELEQRLKLYEKQAKEAQQARIRQEETTLELHMKVLQATEKAQSLEQARLTALMQKESFEKETAQKMQDNQELEEQLKMFTEETEMRAKETARLQAELEASKAKQEEQKQQFLDQTTLPSMPGESSGDHQEENPDLSMEGVANAGSELERVHINESHKDLAALLKSLYDELMSSRDEAKQTRMDLLHGANVKSGRDKYKTLRKIRQGNTKNRVEQFENM